MDTSLVTFFIVNQFREIYVQRSHPKLISILISRNSDSSNNDENYMSAYLSVNVMRNVFLLVKYGEKDYHKYMSNLPPTNMANFT